jgi:hypothetical protein
LDPKIRFALDCGKQLWHLRVRSPKASSIPLSLKFPHDEEEDRVGPFSPALSIAVAKPSTSPRSPSIAGAPWQRSTKSANIPLAFTRLFNYLQISISIYQTFKLSWSVKHA